MATAAAAHDFSELSSVLSGNVITPDHPTYDNVRTVWNGMIDIRPGAIAHCQNVDDVVAAIHFARNHGVEISVRSGGHNAAGKSLIKDGLVIDLGAIDQIQVDPKARTARVGGGATWSQVDAATTVHNLATTGGVVSTTGVGGLTLGGGIGNMMRNWGLSCDNVLAAQVVLASGEVVLADSEHHPDLYWAIRGGGGNFGIVTEFVFQLHPLDGFYGGMILYPRDDALGVLRNFRDVGETAPDQLGLFAGLLHSPEGDPICGYITYYNGSTSEATDAIAPLSGYGSPIADMTAEVPYATAQASLDEAFPGGLPVYWKGNLLASLPDEAIDILIAGANAAPSKLSALVLETMGGAVARVPKDATAFGNRDAIINLAIISRWTDPAEADANIAWARELSEAMAPYSAGVYVNYLGIGDDADRVAEAYTSSAYTKLREVKAKYDPDNLFHRNQNIPPA